MGCREQNKIKKMKQSKKKKKKTRIKLSNENRQWFIPIKEKQVQIGMI